MKDENKVLSDNSSELMTFGGHLEVLSQMLFRIVATRFLYIVHCRSADVVTL